MAATARKILDTTYHAGKAERFIEFSATFKRFLRNKYHVKDIKNLDAEKIANRFNLKGFVFGNYVTQEERYFYLFKISSQLEYLALLKGNNDLGKGILVIGFGSDGLARANAHYSPSSQFINLNRGSKKYFSDFLKGENSFVHEYGHFLDFYQGRTVDKKINFNFASEDANHTSSNKVTDLFSDSVNILVNDKDYYNELPTDYYKKRIEIFARLFETAITHYLREHYKGSELFFDRGYNGAVYYSKSKIKNHRLGQKMVQILKQV